MSEPALLHGLRVVELEGPFGDACARLLASLGADVTRLDANALPDAETLPEQIADADVLIESRGLDHTTLCARHPRLIHASITAFGSYGPRAHFRGSELVCSAMGGVLRLVGDPDRPPVKEALDACSFHAQLAAAAAILIAHTERAVSGRGQHVDVSVQEVAASRLTNAVLLWQFDRRKLERSGDRLRYGRAAVRCIWPLRDGYVFHSLMSGRFGAPANAALSHWMDELGIDNPLRGVDWLAYDRSALPAETRASWEEAIARFFGARTKHEIATEGRQRGINAAVVQEPADVLADPQLLAREFWSDTDPRSPRSFVRVHVSSDTAFAGSSAAASGGGMPYTALSTSPADTAPSAPAALAGLKVLDLSWALVGSLTTKALGDHGACVIKLESAQRACLTRIDVQVAHSRPGNFDDKPWYAHLNTSKLSLGLDLKHARAHEVLDPLIDWADVVVENFSPGTLDKLGLGYAALQRRRPDLIMISASAYGQTGPLAHGWGVDGTSAALSARTWLTGWPDRGPVLPGAVPYADVVVPQCAVAALLAALAHRRQTGQGCHVDVSMYEISVQQTARALLETQLGVPVMRAGNRDPQIWHQGVYPARGSDRWVAISLFDRSDYLRLCETLGGHWPEPGEDFDRALSARTRELDEAQLMLQLQAAGIAAGVVQDVESLLEHDPQLRARPAWTTLDHALLGPFEHQTTPYQLARTPARPSPAPRLGEHTEHVCRHVLGLDADLYTALEVAGLFR